MTVLSIWERLRDLCGKDRGSEVLVMGKEARKWPTQSMAWVGGGWTSYEGIYLRLKRSLWQPSGREEDNKRPARGLHERRKVGVDSIMASNDFHVQIPGTCDCGTLCGKGTLAE